MALARPILEQQKPRDVWAYGRAALSEIWTYVFFGGGPALLFVWGAATGRQPAIWVYLTVLAIGLVVAGFRTWQKERDDRNATVAETVELNAEVDRLGRPCFVSELAVALEDDLQRPDWIKIYMTLVIRNQGTESTIDRWSIVVLPPSATPYLQDSSTLNAAQRGPHNLMSGNLLNDREIIRRGGTKEGWLLYEGPKDRLGLAMGQTPVVEVSFKDVHDREYHVVSRPGFEKQMVDIRTGKWRSA
jgi:hypothetical protein